MDWNENLVAFTVDPDAVVEIFKFVARSELDKDVLTDACRNHAFLIILDFEEGSWWRKDVQSLRHCRIIYQFHFEGVSLAELVPSELDHSWWGTEDAVVANLMELIADT